MKALFLGEGEISGPARYLAAIFTWAKIPFDHQPDQAKIPQPWHARRYDAVILSDYRYSSWSAGAKRWLTEQVTERGTGLLMIGGWASFTGLVGGYGGTDLEKLLPVTCVRGDDRVQRATGALLLPSSGLRPPSPSIGRRQILPCPLPAEGDRAHHNPYSAPSPASLREGAHRAGEGSPPIVCGYHRARPKRGTQVPYSFRDLVYQKGRVSLGLPQPALVLGQVGRARTAAFLTDCAPHWAGGLVDWGRKRVTIRLRNGIAVEVGENYLRFFRQLVTWIGDHSSLSRREGV
jgi:hypothetical protein